MDVDKKLKIQGEKGTPTKPKPKPQYFKLSATGQSSRAFQSVPWFTRGSIDETFSPTKRDNMHSEHSMNAFS